MPRSKVKIAATPLLAVLAMILSFVPPVAAQPIALVMAHSAVPPRPVQEMTDSAAAPALPRLHKQCHFAPPLSRDCMTEPSPGILPSSAQGVVDLDHCQGFIFTGGSDTHNLQNHITLRLHRLR